MTTLSISYKVFGTFKTNPFQLEFMTALEPKRSDGNDNFCEFYNLSKKINGNNINVILMVYDNLKTEEIKSNCFDHHVVVNEKDVYPYQSRTFFDDSKELLVIIFHDSNFSTSEIPVIDSQLERYYENQVINFQKDLPFLPKKVGVSFVKR